MDETAIAFEPPHVARRARPTPARRSTGSRCATTSAQVEIGAFRTERGVTQRIRFNVVLEVSHHAAAQDDDVDKVISYDTITEAIEHELAAERINLLETLAERVAAGCLADRRAVRVFVRIEKLDRIPGTLGVEIVRTRLPDEAPRLRPVDAARGAGARRPPAAWSTSRRRRRRPRRAAWRDALAAWGHPLVLCLGPAAAAAAARDRGPAPHRPPRDRAGRLGLLPTRDPRFGVVATRTELDWALKSGQLSVWAPAHMADRRPRTARRPTPATRPRSPPGSPRSSAPRCSSSPAPRRRPPAPGRPSAPSPARRISQTLA